MKDPVIVASMTLKSRSGLSIFHHPSRLTAEAVDMFLPHVAYIDQAETHLLQAGFRIEAQTESGISFSGSSRLFEEEFGVSLHCRTEPIGSRQVPVTWFEADRPLMNGRFESYAEAIRLSAPAPPLDFTAPPDPSYYHLDVLTDIPRLLNVCSLHDHNITGDGVRVSMIDTGFISYTNEALTSDTDTQITVTHPVLNIDTVTVVGGDGTDYSEGGSFNGKTITLSKELPEAQTQVQVYYSCYHPFYMDGDKPRYHIDEIRAVCGLNKYVDETGHGTAQGANLLAVAPGVTFSFVKYDGVLDYNGRQFPLEAFRAAVQHQRPDIITCSWETKQYMPELHLEVAAAVAKGITVVFAAGNGQKDEITPDAGIFGRPACPIAHPDAISVGGAYPEDKNGTVWQASSIASSYESVIYAQLKRHVPDVVSICGDKPMGVLIVLPTQPSSWADKELGHPKRKYPNGDETAIDDGWIVTSGTSGATPQVAGIAALLLRQYPDLSPAGVKNVLENSARDITSGTSGNGDKAGPGWDKATGFGLVDGQAALAYLKENVCDVFIRSTVEDNGDIENIKEIENSPDIVVFPEKAHYYPVMGQSTKHRSNLSSGIAALQYPYVYVRVQNRGLQTATGKAQVYWVKSGDRGNPNNWQYIGKTAIGSLEPGGFQVLDCVAWTDRPTEVEEGTLVCVLDATGDPGPDISTIQSDDDFVNMVKSHNNMACLALSVTAGT